MAEIDTSTAHDLVETDDRISMSAKRRNLAIQAAEEIEQLCTMVKETLKNDAEHIGVSGVVSRIKFLAQNITGIVGDTGERTDEIAKQLAA